MLHFSTANVALVLVALARPLTADVPGKKKSKYYANLGKYGTFQLEISADDGTMTWVSDLQHIDDLECEGIKELNYHLHQSWTLDTDFATGEDDCGMENLGDHYDPYFACGPASGHSDKDCKGIGRERSTERYACVGSYELGLYNECEVGDLSGKYGPLIVETDGTASAYTERPDPLAALDAEFVAERTINPANKWSSILFHDDTSRVLCAKLFLGTMSESGDEAEGGKSPMDAGRSGEKSGVDVGESLQEGDGGGSPTNIDDPETSAHADDTEEEAEDVHVGETPTDPDDPGKEGDVGGHRLRGKA